MAYGTIKIDTITFTDGGVDKSVSISGLVQNPTFTGNVTVTGTVSGTTATFTTGTFTSLTGTTSQGTTATYTSGSFTSLTGVTTSGTTANFVSGVFTTQISGATITGTAGAFATLTGGVATLTSGVFALGTQALPSITFTGDTDTGIYSPGANQVAITTSGTGRLFVDASGNVTVDTNTFYVNATNNRVGIGTVDPSELLHVAGNARIGANDTSAAQLEVGAGATGNRNSYIDLIGDTTYTDYGFRLIRLGGANNNTVLRHRGTGEFAYITEDAAPLTFYTSNSERLRITSTGTVNIKGAGTAGVTQAVSFDGSAPVDSLVLTSGGLVGVGTSSPGALLHVAGNTDNNVQSILAAGNDSNFRLASINRSAANVSGSELARFGIRYATGTDDSSGVQFFRGNTAAEGHLGLYTGGTTRLYVQGTTGNVGIGTTNPGAALNIGADGDFWLASSVNTVEEKNLISWRIEDGSEGARISAFREDVSNAPHSIAFFTRTSGGLINEKARIDSSGRLLVGTSSARETNTGNDPFVQFERSSGSALVLSATKNGADAFGPYFTLIKSRGTSAGANNLVSSGDELGSILFYGTDGTNPEAGAAIQAYVDGTPGANDMPGRLVFSVTPDGGSSPTTSPSAMTINSGQEVLIGYSTDNGAYKLQVNSQIFATSATIATSDGRYKENVATLDGCVDLVKALRPVSFDWKAQQPITRVDEDGETVMVREAHNFPDGKQVGFIAQEVEEVLAGKPWLGSVIKQNVRPAVTDADGNELAPEEEFLGIAEGNLVAVLASALKDAIGRIEGLEAKVAALKA